MWTCAECRRRFANRNQQHSCGRVALASHFEGRPVQVRRLFDAFAEAVRHNGPVRIEATRTRIGFQVAMIFAAIAPRNTALQGHLVLARRVADERFSRVDSISPRNHVHHFVLRQAADIDGRFRELIAEAYQVGRQAHLVPRRASL